MAKQNSKATTTGRSATHKGTCQICGNLQMLPGGKLAKHGYTTRWGFFSGTCTGSGWGPFETHSDKIEDAVGRATHHAAWLREQAAALLASTDASQVWMHVHQSATWTDRTSRYVWTLLPVQQDEKGAFVITEGRDTNGNTRQRRESVMDYCDATLLSAVQARNAHRAADWLNEALKYDEYVAWQTQRLATWTAQPEKLVSLGDRAAERKGPLVHLRGSYYDKSARACAGSAMAAQKYAPTTTVAAEVTCTKCSAIAAARAAKVVA